MKAKAIRAARISGASLCFALAAAGTVLVVLYIVFGVLFTNVLFPW